MSFNTSFHLCKIKDLRNIIGSKREDIKEKLLTEYATYGDPAEIMGKEPDESEESFQQRQEAAREREKKFIEEEKKKIIQVIDEGSLEGAEDYQDYLLDFVENEGIDDSFAFQAFSSLVDLLAHKPEVPEELTSLLSYITEGRRVTDGQHFQKQDGDKLVGYWTKDESAKLAELLGSFPHTDLGELSKVVDMLGKITKLAVEKDKDIFFISA